MSSDRQVCLFPRNVTGCQADQHHCDGAKLLGLVRFVRAASVLRTWAGPVWLPHTKQGIKAAQGCADRPRKEQAGDDGYTVLPTSQRGNER